MLEQTDEHFIGSLHGSCASGRSSSRQRAFLMKISLPILALTYSSALLASERVLPSVTVEGILAEKTPIVERLQWLPRREGLAALYKAENAGSSQLRIWPRGSGSSRSVADGVSGAISPDGKYAMTFRENEWRMIMVETDGPERHFALPRPEVPGASRWSPDSRYWAFAQGSARPKAKDPVIRTEDGARYIEVGEGKDEAKRDGTTIVSVLDCTTGKLVRSFEVVGGISEMEWTANKTLYAVALRYALTESQPLQTPVVRMDLGTGDVHDIFQAPGRMQRMTPRVSPDGKWLALAYDTDDGRWDDFVSLMLVDLNTLQIRRLTRDFAVLEIVWSAQSDAVYCVGRDGGWTQIQRVALDGTAQAVTNSASEKRLISVSDDGKEIAYTAADGLGRLLLNVVSTSQATERTWAVLNDPTTRFRLGDFRQVWFPADNNIQVAGFLLLPPDFDATRKYPLYISVHGGGNGSLLSVRGQLGLGIGSGPLEWHALSALGYVVFVPDYRTSGAYGIGVAAARYRRGDFSGLDTDARDIEAGTGWMLQQPYIDSKRVAVLGHSAGGGRVSLLLTRTRLYQAGILTESVDAGPLVSVLRHLTGKEAGNASWIRTFELALGRRLDEEPERYRESNLFDGYKSRTPTLIIVGNTENGATDPIAAEALFSTLRAYRIPTRMLRYVDAGHVFRQPAMFHHMFAQVLKWSDQHLDIARDADGRILWDGLRARSRLTPLVSASK